MDGNTKGRCSYRPIDYPLEKETLSETGRPLRILGFSYAGNPMLTFNTFLGKAIELSFPERKCNKMIVPKIGKVMMKLFPF